MVWSKKLPNILGSFSSAELCGRGSLVLAGIAALGCEGSCERDEYGVQLPQQPVPVPELFPGWSWHPCGSVGMGVWTPGRCWSGCCLMSLQGKLAAS